MTEIEIVQVHVVGPGTAAGADLNDEYVVIQNQSSYRYQMVGWSIAVRMPAGQFTPVFEFPKQVGGNAWSFDPGEEIYLMTGHGKNTFVNDGFYPPQFHFFTQRDMCVWSQHAAGICLRRRDGEIVHSLKLPEAVAGLRTAPTPSSARAQAA